VAIGVDHWVAEAATQSANAGCGFVVQAYLPNAGGERALSRRRLECQARFEDEKRSGRCAAKRGIMR
jgi:hypothetical protein